MRERPDLNALLGELLSAGLADGCFPSACCAVGRKKAVLAERCAGEAPLPGDGPADRDTLYDVASLTKVISTSMLALLAVEAGQLSLTDTLGGFFPDAPEDKRGITLEMLLTHTAGFAPSFRLDMAGIAPEDAAACILRSPLEHAPGERPVYSCMGFILLGKLLERRFGAPLNALARAHVFGPLGMRRTGYRPPRGERCAATEIVPGTGAPLIGVVHDENARFLGGVSGNAGVFMPLADGERFMKMLASGGDGLLRPGTLARAIENRTPGADEHRGLGFQLSGTSGSFMGALPEGSFGHTGFTGTSLAVEPKSGFWVLLLANRVYPTRENARFTPFWRKLHTALWERFSDML